ncbi:hypothetical protein ACWGB8_16225 [Kitasatospora sp. NPDC054939]
MALVKKVSAGIVAVVASGTLLFAGAGAAMAGDSGHSPRHTATSTASVDTAAVEAALRAVVTAYPQIIGSPLCPVTGTADDVGACVTALQERLAPLLAEHPELAHRISAASVAELLSSFLGCRLAGV